MKKRNKTLQRIIIKSKTERFFTWFEVAWPHARPLMTNIINHISCKDISPSDVILLNILRATRSAMNRPDPSIVIDKSRLDREYLIIFYRSLLTAAARELSEIRLTSGNEQWNPLSQSLSTWSGTHNQVYVTKGQRTIVDARELSHILFNKMDRRILGREIERIYVPYPFRRS